MMLQKLLVRYFIDLNSIVAKRSLESYIEKRSSWNVCLFRKGFATLKHIEYLLLHSYICTRIWFLTFKNFTTRIELVVMFQSPCIKNFIFNIINLSLRYTIKSTTFEKNKFLDFVPVKIVEGSIFNITKISRLQMGAYLCIASNSIPPTVSKRIMLTVQCEYFSLW